MIDGDVVGRAGGEGAEDVDAVDADDGDRCGAESELVARKWKLLVEEVEKVL